MTIQNFSLETTRERACVNEQPEIGRLHECSGSFNIAAPHIFKNAADYYAKKPEKRNSLTAQLTSLKTRQSKQKEEFLKKAIVATKNLEKRKEFINRLDNHYGNRVEKLRSSGEHGEMGVIKSAWDRFRKYVSENTLWKLLEKEKPTALELPTNQVYRIAKSKSNPTGLPGKLIRSTAKASGQKDADSAYNIAQEVAEYAKKFQGFDFFNELEGLPQVSTVGDIMDNAYYSQDIQQIVIGKGDVLFHDLSFSQSILRHEWGHMKLSRITGLHLNNGMTGLGYFNEGRAEPGGLNEAGADIDAITQAIEGLKKGDVEVIPSMQDEAVRKCMKIAPGIWKKGTQNDALRDALTGIGYTSQKVLDIVGTPIEQYYLRYEDSHDINDVIVNRPALDGIVLDSVDKIDSHYLSALYLKVYANELDSMRIPARKAHDLWLEAYKVTSYAPSGLDFFRTMQAVGETLKNNEEYATIDLPQEILKSFALQGFPT